MLDRNTKFFLGILGAQAELQDGVPERLRSAIEKRFGVPERELPATSDWTAPESYEHEIGTPLLSSVLVFSGTVSLVAFPDIKSQAMEMEREFYKPVGERREFNLNPGFVSSTGMYLLSHKPAATREALDASTWMDQQMASRGYTLEPLPHCFDEYLVAGRIAEFEELLHSLIGNQKAA